MKEKMFDYFMQLYKEETERYEKNLKNKKIVFSLMIFWKSFPIQLKDSLKNLISKKIRYS